MARLVLVGVVAAVAGAVLAAFAVTQLDRQAAPAIVIDDPRADAAVVVEVDGAVATPGVYTLGIDARWRDALAAAGGPRADTDLAAVNLAQRVHDEERIVVPARGPAPTPASADVALTDARRATQAPATSMPVPTGTAAGRPVATRATGATAPININTATAAELDTLPGIGPAKAQSIVDYRAAHGPFRSVDDLANVKGISPAMVDAMRGLVTVGP